MATRSAGTGVIVALVVFVLSTVFLLVLSIVFYAGQANEAEAHQEDENRLRELISQEQQTRPGYKAVASQAQGSGRTVYQELTARQSNLLGYVAGDPNTNMEQLKTEFERMGATEGKTIKDALADARRAENSLQNELDSAQDRISNQGQQIESLQGEIQQKQQECEQQLQAIRDQTASYDQTTQTYLDELQQTKYDFEQARENLAAEYDRRERNLTAQIDDLSATNSRLQQRVDDLKSVVEQFRISGPNPAELVDGRVINVIGNDQVFINIGRESRVVRGMTFEVYADANAIRPTQSGDYPRGKASLEVIKVGEVTSTCKLTRSIQGRPVVRDDVIANGIFDPDYEFKFLVHGLFDVDGDGKPSEAEANYLRDLIIEWGGAVVTGDELRGDLDFLVLGEQPPHPGPSLSGNPTPEELHSYTQKRSVYDQYNNLFEQAQKAQIPVLNWNRLSTLIGHTNR